MSHSSSCQHKSQDGGYRKHKRGYIGNYLENKMLAENMVFRSESDEKLVVRTRNN